MTTKENDMRECSLVEVTDEYGEVTINRWEHKDGEGCSAVDDMRIRARGRFVVFKAYLGLPYLIAECPNNDGPVGVEHRIYTNTTED